jgi:hypothetical protein
LQTLQHPATSSEDLVTTTLLLMKTLGYPAKSGRTHPDIGEDIMTVNELYSCRVELTTAVIEQCPDYRDQNE